MTIEAYEPQLPNDWVRPIAIGVLVLIAGVGIAGWIAGPGTGGFKWTMSIVTVLLEVWALNASAQWARALERERVGGPLVYWFLIACACAGWSLFSIYHGLNVLTAGMGAERIPAYVGLTLLASMLPFAMWAVERVERAPLKPAKPADAPTGENALPAPTPTLERPPVRKSGQRAPTRANGRTPALRVVQNAGIAAALAGVGYMPKDPAAFERAAMIARANPGISPADLAQQAGVQRGTVWNWMQRAPEVFEVQAAAA
jgi:hypothetical protein